MNLYHCTDFDRLQSIVEAKCLILGEVPEFPILSHLGIRGFWVSTETYTDQFFGPYRLTFSAASVLPTQFLLLERSPTRDVLLGSYSPQLAAIGELTGLRYVIAGSSDCPIKRAEGLGTWSPGDKKVDVILDFPLPISIATGVSAEMSLHDRNGAPRMGWDRLWQGSGARLAALLLIRKSLAIEQLFGPVEALSLAQRLFRELCGFTLRQRAGEVRGVLPPEQLAAVDIVFAAAECLVAGQLDDARLIAALSGAEATLAEKIAAAVNQRLGINTLTKDAVSLES